MVSFHHSRLIHWVKSILISLSLYPIVFSCGQKSPGELLEDKIIAEVYNKKLYLKEILNYIPENISKEDSIQLIRSYTDKWVKETLFLLEAEKKLPKDLEIDKMVKDYRASLITNNYELMLIEQKLDTLITEKEIQEYYEANKDQYQLEYAILRCRLFKLNHQITPKDKDFTDKNWKSNNKKDLNYLERVCKEFGAVCYLDDKVWHKLDHIQSVFPSGILQDGMIKNQQEFTFRDQQYHYYLKVYERISKQELAPLSFIEEQARKYILRKRIMQLMQQLKDEIYEREIQTNSIRLYY